MGPVFLLVLVTIMCTTLQIAKSTSSDSVADSITAFTADFYTTLSNAIPGNLICSPFSVSVVMGMLQAGAGGTTAKYIRKGMRFPSSDKTTFKGFKSLLLAVNSNRNVTIAAANRVYTETGFSLKPEFTKILQNDFKSKPTQLNFADSVKSAETINSFVDEITNSKIKNLISPQDLDSTTRLVLVNGIYFKGIWKHQFNPDDTAKAPFYATKGGSTQTYFMHLHKVKIPYVEFPELGASAVSIPYRGDSLSMIVVLPDALDGIEDLERKLRENNFFETIPKQLFSGGMRDVDLTLPKFTLESTLDLESVMAKLGMGIMFSGHANFSGISTTPFNLFVSKMIQKAFIEVNEEGTTAAAATWTTVTTAVVQVPVVFKADHPFIAFIYDMSEKLILFVAKKTK